jgi:hypothetical protein
VDGDTDGKSWEGEYSLPVTARGELVRVAGNWVLSLYELYYLDPHADRYALFQDDVAAVRGLRHYLETLPYPEKGYQNLYTWDSNMDACPTAEDGTPRRGWFRSQQNGRGALGLVFNQEALQELLSASSLVKRLVTLPKKGWRAIDGGVVEAMNQKGYSEYVHNPSLLQHTGLTSVMDKRKQVTTHEPDHPLFRYSEDALASTFPGEDYNPVVLLPPREERAVPKGWGDRLEGALSYVGVTKERVEKWLGQNCGCTERQEKLNDLGRWVRRALLGKDPVNQSKQYLEEILDEKPG